MHFSLDLWNTLLIPNKKYAQKRNAILADRLLISITDATNLYTSTKTQLDKEAEILGRGYSTARVYERLSRNAEVLTGPLAYGLLPGIREELEREFLINPPTVLPQAIDKIQQMQREGYTFSIASNTNFISGVVLRPYLESLGLKFLFCVFSDLERLSKPHPVFFERVARRYLEKRDRFETNNLIVHIGDNPVCDRPGKLMGHYIIDGAHELPSALEVFRV